VEHGRAGRIRPNAAAALRRSGSGQDNQEADGDGGPS
jgi:hypothetical protein